MAPTTSPQSNTAATGLLALPIVWLGLGWLAGIALASVVGLKPSGWLVLTAIVLAIAILFRRATPWLRLTLLGLIALNLGGARYQFSHRVFDESFVSSYNDSGQLTLTGVVVDEPDVRDTYTNLRVRADSVLLPGADGPIDVRGLVLLRAPRYPAHGYGDQLEVVGMLETPPEFEDFSYADHLARQGVHSIIRNPVITLQDRRQANPLLQTLFNFKARALDVTGLIFPEPQAALLSGILLGVESGIPADLKAAFQATGTSHIIAISGFNISILAGIFSTLAGRAFGRRRGLPVALAAIALYTLLAGADASVVRAAIMGSLVLVGREVGRAPIGLSLLLVAAILMTLANPMTLWDVGFQLSLFATLGLILYAERFEAAFRRFAERHVSPEAAERLTGWAGEYVLVTLAAQVTTLPILLYTFRRFSPISFVANVFILPAQPAVMIVSGLAVLLGLAWLPLGRLVAWVAWPFTAYTIALVEAFASVPGASVEIGRIGLSFVVGIYAVLFGVTAVVSLPAERRPAWWSSLTTHMGPNAAIASLGIVCLLVWNGVLRAPDGNLHVTYFDVGDGDAVLIESPGGRRVLVDGGSSPSRLGDALGRRLPMWDRHLDWAIVAAPDDSRVAGLAGMLGRFRVGGVLVAGEPSERAAYRALLETLAAQQVPPVTAETGQRLDLGNGAYVEVLAAGEAGAVLRVRYDRAAFLLPIGIDLETQAALLTQRRVTPHAVVLLADRRSDLINTREWLEASNPWAVVLSASASRAPEVLTPGVQAIVAGYTLLRTDRDGWVEFATDGERLWVWTER